MTFLTVLLELLLFLLLRYDITIACYCVFEAINSYRNKYVGIRHDQVNDMIEIISQGTLLEQSLSLGLYHCLIIYIYI